MADIEYRYVVDRVEDDFEHGHRESNDGSGWKPVLRSEYARNLTRFWFQKTPVEIMRSDMGFETSNERANEFANATENNPDLWYYLASASRNHLSGEASDEPLKWIMGTLAAEVKVRGLRFVDIPTILPAHYLSWFAYAIMAGDIDRTFAKVIFAELLLMKHLPLHDPGAVLGFDTLIKDPRFKAVDESAIDAVIEQIIADNPEQFEKAKMNPKLIQWFVGQTLKATQGKASAPVVITKMQEKLSG